MLSQSGRQQLIEPDDQVREAALSCPVEAILLTDADTEPDAHTGNLSRSTTDSRA